MHFFISLLYSIAVSFLANCYALIVHTPQSLFFIVPLFLFVNLFAGCFVLGSRKRKLRICFHGSVLLTAFCVSVVVSVISQIALAFRMLPLDIMGYVGSLVFCICVNLILFWNSILCVYLTSTQLGVKLRVAGILCGMIPIVNLVVLFIIIRTTATECLFEAGKERLNRKRAPQQVCATKYPILLVHGVFFRDSEYINYWGRIPGELQENGALIFYGNQPSAASVAECAAELKVRIEEILAQTGAEKVNIIAHSKGGLDSRYAISVLGMADRVASLTTINTPHRGCLFADYLLTKIPTDIKLGVAATYNTALNSFGEPNADFLAAVSDLTVAGCQLLGTEMSIPEGVYCQSVGSVMPKAASGKFPLNFTYHLAKHFSGENDGLVSEDSFGWGEKYVLLRPFTKEGISHGDIIDLNRVNIKGFDVREFYVSLVSDLKNRGL